jgi:hypothetical protein
MTSAKLTDGHHKVREKGETKEEAASASEAEKA